MADRPSDRDLSPRERDQAKLVQDLRDELGAAYRALARESEERARAESVLRTSEARLLEAHQIARLGHWELDLTTGVLWWSPGIFELFEVDPAAFGASYEAFLSFVHPEDRAGVDRAYTESVRDRTPYAITHRLLMRDGRVKWVREACRTEYDADGKPMRSAGTVQDVTDVVRAEEERGALQAQLFQAQKMESVGRLAGGVAHDFGNMLSVIIGYTQLALNRVEPMSPVWEDLRAILDAALRSANLTRQLLASARQQTISPRVIDLNDTVGGLLNMLRRMVGEDIDLLWKPDEALWPVCMDPVQVDQVLANLLVNARDAIEGPGTVTVETKNEVLDEAYARTHLEAAPGDYVLLAVSDSGKGMTEGVLARAFEPFFTTKETGVGTGLGLATVHGIVKQNNGYINLYSEVGQGTTLRIYLPRAQGRVSETVAPPAARPALGTETVLLVEDEGVLLSLAKSILEEYGYTVLAARTPAVALDLARQHSGPIHLLITDTVMPGMNGREVANALSEIRPETRVLFMSGYTANVIARHGVLEEGVQFLGKPFTVEALIAKVREVLAV